MIKAVLFDMDGVIVYSKDSTRACFEILLKEFGFELPKEKEYIVYMGGNDREIISALLPGVDDETLEQMVKRASEITENLKYLKLNPGVEEALETLSKRFKLAIVSNDNRSSLERKLGMFNITDYFSAIISENDVERVKPDPQPLLKAMELLGVTREEAVYIGDNEVDKEAGEAAGVKTVIVKDLQGKDGFFKKGIWEYV
ncbi:MAG: HAD-IA family hydrolase [Candidatus Micrarchaeota archaeon]